jgi:hypothetical protein
MAQQRLVGQGFLVIEALVTLKHTEIGRTPLDKLSAQRRDHYLTTHKTTRKETSMPPAEFERTIPASERPKTHALDLAATGMYGSIATDIRNSLTGLHLLK